MRGPATIRILGAGPAGLWLARSLKRVLPAFDVAIVEQNPADATYGFGVVFSSTALDFIGQTDPAAMAEITTHMQIWSGMTITCGDEALAIDGGGFAGVERIALLQTLQRLCEAAGVRIEYNRRVERLAELEDADLVVAADGTNSVVRAAIAGFETHRSELRNRFCWYGTETTFPTHTLTFRSAGGGHFVAHHYRFKPDKSTFLVECDEATWAGVLEPLPDLERKAVCERVFATELAGKPLIENNSVWRRFPVVFSEHWWQGKYVLVGDALRSAHYSIGSGTRLAIDDAIALSGAIADAPDVPAALALYEQRRRPAVDRFRDAARRSYEWYEGLPEKLQLPPFELVHDFMMRTGRVDEGRLRGESPEFMRAYDAYRSAQAESRA